MKKKPGLKQMKVNSYFYLSQDRELSITKRESEAFFKTNAPDLQQSDMLLSLLMLKDMFEKIPFSPFLKKHFFYLTSTSL